jgi:hypothetical protein
MLNLWFWFDILSTIFAVITLFFAYRLWAMLGRHGIAIWLILALAWAIFLRVTNIALDVNCEWTWLKNSGHYTLPLYIFLAIGVWGLYRQVKDKLTIKEVEDSNKEKWSWFLNLGIKKKK